MNEHTSLIDDQLLAGRIHELRSPTLWLFAHMCYARHEQEARAQISAPGTESDRLGVRPGSSSLMAPFSRPRPTGINPTAIAPAAARNACLDFGTGYRLRCALQPANIGKLADLVRTRDGPQHMRSSPDQPGLKVRCGAGDYLRLRRLSYDPPGGHP